MWGGDGGHTICNKSMPSITYASTFYSKQKKTCVIGGKKVGSLPQLNLKLDSKIIVANFRLYALEIIFDANDGRMFIIKAIVSLIIAKISLHGN